MYSKEQGGTYDGRRPGTGRIPSYRQPEKPKIQVPTNYSGYAIVDGEERPLGSSEDREKDVPMSDLPGEDTPTPHFDGLPKVSDLGNGHRRAQPTVIPASFEVTEPPRSAEGATEVSSAAQPPARKSSLFDLSRFPFGHGFGWEEILILGLILFFLYENADCEDRGDLDETVILLGLLLLLG